MSITMARVPRKLAYCIVCAGPWLAHNKKLVQENNRTRDGTQRTHGIGANLHMMHRTGGLTVSRHFTNQR